MTLSTARKLAAHATVGCAFGSITAGGDISNGLTLAIVLALVISFFFGESIGRGRAGLFTLLSGVSLFALMWLAVTGVFDLVVAASLFATSLAVNRLYARQSAADDGLLYLAALMMLAGGAALSAELAYGLWFAGFTFCTTAALTLSHLSRAVEEAQATPSRANALVAPKLFSGLLGLSAAAIAGSALVFFLFPRFTAGISLRHMPGRQSPFTGFSDTVQLGGHGTLKGNPRPVLRIRVRGQRLQDELNLLWKGRSFDFYDGRGWHSTADAEGVTGRKRYEPVDDAAKPVTFDLELLPSAGTNVVFVPGTPLAVEHPKRALRGPLTDPTLLSQDSNGDLRIVPVSEEGYSYTVRTDLRDPVASQRELLGLGTDYPEEISARYLQLPPNLDPRVKALAERLTKGQKDPVEKLRAIAKELAKFKYTTELPGEVPDPLSHFLFERKAGHCEFFSTALAVLLRTAGVPTRNVTGFFGGRRVSGEDYYLLRGGDAHSWTEVYFPGRGFIAFDPTPPDGREGSPSEMVEYFNELLDRASMRWRAAVVDYSINDQFRYVTGAMQALSRGFDRLSGRSGAGASTPLRILVALVLLGAAVLVLRTLWARRQVSDDVSPARREAVLLYRSMQTRLKKRGLVKRPAQTPREFAQEIVEKRAAPRETAEVVSLVTERYLAARFGPESLSQAELRDLKQKIAGL